MAHPFDFMLIGGPWNRPQGHASAGSDWELGSSFGPVFTMMMSASATGCDSLHTRLFPKNRVCSWGIWVGGPLKTHDSDKMGRPRLPVSAGEPLASAAPCTLLAAGYSASPPSLGLHFWALGRREGLMPHRFPRQVRASASSSTFPTQWCTEAEALPQAACSGHPPPAPHRYQGGSLVLQAELPECPSRARRSGSLACFGDVSGEGRSSPSGPCLCGCRAWQEAMGLVAASCDPVLGSLCSHNCATLTPLCCSSSRSSGCPQLPCSGEASGSHLHRGKSSAAAVTSKARASCHTVLGKLSRGLGLDLLRSPTPRWDMFAPGCGRLGSMTARVLTWDWSSRDGSPTAARVMGSDGGGQGPDECRGRETLSQWAGWAGRGRKVGDSDAPGLVEQWRGDRRQTWAWALALRLGLATAGLLVLHSTSGMCRLHVWPGLGRLDTWSPAGSPVGWTVMELWHRWPWPHERHSMEPRSCFPHPLASRASVGLREIKDVVMVRALWRPHR